jgi:hypothetical protein
MVFERSFGKAPDGNNPHLNYNLNSQQAYEITGNEIKNGNTTLQYLCILVKDETAVIVVGRAGKNHAQNLKEFRAMTEGIRIKDFIL